MKIIKKFTDYILNIVYPRKCPVCQRILNNQKALVCQECAGRLRPLTKNYCMKCGKPVPEEAEYCGECGRRSRSFTRGRSVYPYNEQMQRSILAFKQYGVKDYCGFYVDAVCRYLGGDVSKWNPDVIIPVPLSKKSRRKRGFNQAELLAWGVGERLNIPVADNVLLKTKETKQQKSLDAGERRRNLQDAFFTMDQLDGLKVLIVDDIYTTGSTIETAAECLKEAGAREVYFVTVCSVEA